MLILNTLPEHGTALDPRDAATLGVREAHEVGRMLSLRENHRPTPLVALAALAHELGVASIHVKDEGHRLGLGSFKALGGSYAVIRLVLAAAARALGRTVGVDELNTSKVRAIAAGMTFTCATDGNHGRSVAHGAGLVGAKCVIFVHAGVTQERVAAIQALGAETVRVAGSYDDSVEEARRVAGEKAWVVVSDTSWPGYEEIPGLVMQGYTALVQEAIQDLQRPPTHVFIQAGVGGIAAAVAGHLALMFGEQRPIVVVVDPDRAACLFESARAGTPVQVPHGEPTVMAMLECYKPSLIAWRVLSRMADAFMTVSDEQAVSVMRRLADPLDGDAPLVAGESGGVGLAGLIKVAADPVLRDTVSLTRASRVFVINTEGATDARRYETLVGLPPSQVAARARQFHRVAPIVEAK